MLPKRVQRSGSPSNFTASERDLILAAETIRTSDSSPIAMESAQSSKPEERISVFWRLFGGTIMSITALFFLNAYQSLSHSIQEVRADLNRMRESAADFIKKDDFTARTATMWTSVRELQTLSAPVTLLTSKINGIEQSLSLADKERREIQAALAQIPTIKERVSTFEDQRKVSEQDHKDLANLSALVTALKEKDATIEKIIKDTEAERRELIREMQTLRERIAKCEGKQEAKPEPAKN